MARTKRPEPSALLELRGGAAASHRPARSGEPATAPLSPARPVLLSGPGAEEWDRIHASFSGLNLLTEADAALLRMYCENYGQWIQAMQAVQMLDLPLVPDVCPVAVRMYHAERARWLEAGAQVARHGTMMQEGASLRTNPWLAAERAAAAATAKIRAALMAEYRMAERRMYDSAREFGFTPSSRVYTRATSPASQPADELEAYRRRKARGPANA